MNSMSAATFRRLYLLYLLSRFQNGAYGAKRIHKVTYLSERESKSVRPFEFKRHYYGQYSIALDDIIDQLESMGYVAAFPLDTAIIVRIGDQDYNMGGNRFVASDKGASVYRKVLASVHPDLPKQIEYAVKKFGYLKEQELLDLCYNLPEFQVAAEGETLLESNLPDSVEVDLTDDELEDLEITLNPRLMASLLRLTEALDESDVDWGRVKQVDYLQATGS